MSERTPELQAALEREAATREILRVIARSPDDEQPVFEAILEHALRLCHAPRGGLFLVRDDHLHYAADAGSQPEMIEYVLANPYPLDDPDMVICRAARDRVPVQIEDLMDETYWEGNPRRVASVKLGQMRTLVSVPIVKDDETLGVIALFRREVNPFSDDDIETVRIFAEQAVVAIDNVHRFKALAKSLERQTATSEILRSISQSPTDCAPVFDTILSNAIRLCGAPFGTLFLLRDDYLQVVADAGSRPEMVEHLRNNPIALDEPDAVTSRAARDQVPTQIADLMDDAYHSGDPRRIAAVKIGGVRTWLAVPLLNGEETVGVIALYRHEVKPFADDEVALVSTFADQAVIAIENVRQFQAVQDRTAELTRSLERQTATSEILRSISRSPTDYAPVFDTILDCATRLCGAPFGTLFLLRDDHLHMAADSGAGPEFLQHMRTHPIATTRSGPAGPLVRAAREQAPVQFDDLVDDRYRSGEPVRTAAVDIGKVRTLLGVPLVKGDETLGVIALYRHEISPFADDDIALVTTFADQAVIAIENVRQFQQVQTRTAELTQSLERQTATSEILRVISRSPSDYQPVFDTILEHATRLCRAPFGALFLARDGELHPVAVNGPPDFVEFWVENPISIADESSVVLGGTARERAPKQVLDYAEVARRTGVERRIAAAEHGGIRTLLGVPILKGDEVAGVILMYRQKVEAFADSEIELVSTFADQAVIAIENVRSFQAVQARTAELTQSLERQTATSEILRTISRSPTDYAPVFDTILGRACHLCRAQFAFFFLLRDGHLHVVASVGGTPEFQDFFRDTPIPLDHPDSITARAARERSVVNVPDVTETQTYKVKDNVRLAAAIDAGGIRSFLAVPMYKNDSTVGVLSLFRHEVGAFADEDVQLVSTFADQAVIAIENVRLFRALEQRNADLNASLERQTATSEILRAISRSPTDYQPVFETILDNALRLCHAPFGYLMLLRDEHLHLAASRGAQPAMVDS